MECSCDLFDGKTMTGEISTARGVEIVQSGFERKDQNTPNNIDTLLGHDF